MTTAAAVQVLSVGQPATVKLTVPVKPLTAAIVKVLEAVCPALMVTVVGLAVKVKSAARVMVAFATADVPALKLASPE